MYGMGPGGVFNLYTLSAAGTASFTLTAPTSNSEYLITDITAYSDLANAVMRVQGSATTVWQGTLASANIPMNIHFQAPLKCGKGANLSALLTGTASAAFYLAGFIIS